MRYRVLVAVAVAVGLMVPRPVAACPFCSVQGQTFAGEVNQADFIVLGELKNAKPDPVDFAKGTTELHIEKVVKDHPYLRGKKILLLPRLIRLDPKTHIKTMVFCGLTTGTKDLAGAAAASSLVLADFDRQTLDPYRGDELEPDSKLPEYLAGSFALKDRDVPARLAYFLNFLDSSESKISTDAYLEFANADYKDVRTLAEKASADKILGWLQDPQTPPSRLGLYGLMLGHAGSRSHAAALRAILDDPKKQYSSGLDGLLAGYVLLEPTAGWELVSKLGADDKKDFQLRYAVLRVLRFFWETRPDVVSNDKVLAVMKVLVAQSDIADLPIEDLRKWQQWNLTEFVLGFGGQESHKQFPIVRRAILRFALTAESRSPVAAEYIKKAENEDPDRVKQVRELLADEKPKPEKN